MSETQNKIFLDKWEINLIREFPDTQLLAVRLYGECLEQNPRAFALIKKCGEEEYTFKACENVANILSKYKY